MFRQRLLVEVRALWYLALRYTNKNKIVAMKLYDLRVGQKKISRVWWEIKSSLVVYH